MIEKRYLPHYLPVEPFQRDLGGHGLRETLKLSVQYPAGCSEPNAAWNGPVLPFLTFLDPFWTSHMNRPLLGLSWYRSAVSGRNQVMKASIFSHVFLKHPTFSQNGTVPKNMWLIGCWEYPCAAGKFPNTASSASVCYKIAPNFTTCLLFNQSLRSVGKN